MSTRRSVRAALVAVGVLVSVALMAAPSWGRARPEVRRPRDDLRPQGLSRLVELRSQGLACRGARPM